MKLVCYLHYPGSLAHVRRLTQRLCQMLDPDEQVWVYDARRLSPADLVGLDASIRLLPYGGEDWEFGAYQLGLDALTGPAASAVVFMNDTAGRNYPLPAGDLRRFALHSRLAEACSQPCIVGKIERRGQGGQGGWSDELAGLRLDRWIRSNLFCLNAPALGLLSHRLFDPAIFRAPHLRGGQLVVGLPVSSAFEQYLLSWLSPAAGASGWLAHAGQAVADPAVLRDKLGSILLEKHLSARLQEVQAELLSYEPASPSLRHAWAVWLFFKRRGLQRRWRALRGAQRASS
jgi:hypothetical protein